MIVILELSLDRGVSGAAVFRPACNDQDFLQQAGGFGQAYEDWGSHIQQKGIVALCKSYRRKTLLTFLFCSKFQFLTRQYRLTPNRFNQAVFADAVFEYVRNETIHLTQQRGIISTVEISADVIN